MYLLILISLFIVSLSSYLYWYYYIYDPFLNTLIETCKLLIPKLKSPCGEDERTFYSANEMNNILRNSSLKSQFTSKSEIMSLNVFTQLHVVVLVVKRDGKKYVVDPLIHRFIDKKCHCYYEMKNIKPNTKKIVYKADNGRLFACAELERYEYLLGSRFTRC